MELSIKSNVVFLLLSLLFCLPAQLLSLELVKLSFELCMLIVSISYYHDIIICNWLLQNQLITAIALIESRMTIVTSKHH